MSSSIKRILVYGGSGALGDHLVTHFKSRNYWVVSVDMKENKEASENILVDVGAGLNEQQNKIEESLKPMLAGDSDVKLDAILNVAGGWAGGNAAAEKFIHNADLMWKQSVWSSLISASLASKYLKANGGVLTLPGAAAALNATPGMIGYGVAKAAVHQLTKSLAFNEPDDNKSGLPANTFVAAILPVTLDTPMNRKWMPKADTSTWTPLTYIAEMFEKWIENELQRPPTGSLVKLVTTNNQTDISLY